MSAPPSAIGGIEEKLFRIVRRRTLRPCHAGAVRQPLNGRAAAADSEAPGLIRLLLGLRGKIEAADLLCGTKPAYVSSVQPQRTVAELCHRTAVVRNEQQRSPQTKAVEKPHALLLEGGIAHRENFVDDKDIGIDVGAQRKSETRVHTARIALERLIHERADVRKTGNRIEARGRFFRAEAEHGRADMHIFPACEFRIETGSERQHCGHPPAQGHRAFRGPQGSADHLQQR
jgi:hypothetical protein